MSEDKPDEEKAGLPALAEHGDPRPFLRLVPAQHNQQPKFMAALRALLQPLADMLRIARELPTLFDVETAVGQQLDMTGRWIGLTRRIVVENIEFFSWDIDGYGWDEKDWYGPFADDKVPVILDDEHYRLVLLARIGANMWDGTRQGAYDAWDKYFGPLGYQVLIFDNYERAIGWLTWDEEHPSGWWDNSFWDQADMADRGRCVGTMWMEMLLLGPPPDPVLTALFTGGYFDLRPAGVGIKYVTTQYSDDNPLGYPMFAWDEGPEFPHEPVGPWFSWDDPAFGWDDADWYEPPAGAEPVVAAEPTLWLAGWDIGSWGREIRPLA